MLATVAARVVAGETVTFRPTGSSMAPIIQSRDLVTVAPVDAERIEVGDVVLAKVSGTIYLHKVSAIDKAKRRVQISNNRGRVNGWTSFERVYGMCTHIEGNPRARALEKARTKSSDRDAN